VGGDHRGWAGKREGRRERFQDSRMATTCSSSKHLTIPLIPPLSPRPSGFIAEKLYYANTTKMCSAPTAEEVSKWKSPYILMVDRGDCTFVTKVQALPLSLPPSLPLSPPSPPLPPPPPPPAARAVGDGHEPCPTPH